MTNEATYVNLLEQRDIKPTAIRLLVLDTLSHTNRAFSLLDLEERLVTVDRSSIFRTITLFLGHHLIHAIDDGSGSLKYALCGTECNCEIDDLHTHFYCEACHRTFCLKKTHVPQVALPEGFTMHSINYVIKGLCSDCAAGKKAHSV